MCCVVHGGTLGSKSNRELVVNQLTGTCTRQLQIRLEGKDWWTCVTNIGIATEQIDAPSLRIVFHSVFKRSSQTEAQMNLRRWSGIGWRN